MARKHLLTFVVAISLPLLSGCVSVKEASATQIKDNGIRIIKKADKSLKESEPLPSGVPYTDVPSLVVHYQRNDEAYQDWGFWFWADGKDGAEYPMNYTDEYGGVAYYPLSTFLNATRIGFIAKKNAAASGGDAWAERDDLGDRFINTDFIDIDSHNCYHVYLFQGAAPVYLNAQRTTIMDDVMKCEFTDSNTIYIKSRNAMSSVAVKKNGALAEGTPVFSDSNKVLTFTVNGDHVISDMFTADINFDVSGKSYTAVVSIQTLYDDAFDEAYNYDGDLGALYEPTRTTFKLWSPVSNRVELRIYDNGTPTSVDADLGSDTHLTYDMEMGEKGVYEVTVNGDLEGKYYTYYVVNPAYPNGKEVIDPYAKSAGVNGIRGMVVDFEKANPSGWDEVDYLPYDRKELTVYETHIAELTCSDTWGGDPDNAKKFKGFYETGTTYQDNDVTVKTGFDHIKELGVNAVQIIPFFDQDNDETNMTFNWGYNPLNYNVVEGGYSSNPHDGYARIRELKELVQAYNEAGITIIMDVVYNHVSGLGNSPLNITVPYYYFRYVDGSPSNGSGCGNETASEKYMFRKFMIDSTTFWTREYKIGGFRFDLMGIHDVETMNLLTAANQAINEHAVIYGEPWAGGDTALPAGMPAAVQANAQQFQGYGAFNDKLRDSLISGGLAQSYSRMWATQNKGTINPEAVATGIKGITKGVNVGPDKTVSYVTCHDNYTLHDRVSVADYTSSRDVSEYISEEDKEKINALCSSVVFTSQGTSFMLAGEEMLRTKIIYDENGNPVMATNNNGDTLNIPEVSGNSYNLSYKTNEINYQWKVDHLQLFHSYQKLVALKKNADGLHKVEPNQVDVLDEGRVIKVTFSYGNKTFEAYHRNGVVVEETSSNSANALQIALSFLTLGLVSCKGNDEVPGGGGSGGSNLFAVDTRGAELYLDTLGRQFDNNSMVLQPYETLIISR